MPTTPPPFKPQAYMDSLEKLSGLPASSIIVGHYGQVPEDPGSYLRRHRDEYARWVEAVREALSEGVKGVADVAEYVAERIPSARRAADHPNPIVSRMFYLASIWGLVEAFSSSGD